MGRHFGKAFNSVPHKRLIAKLSAMGVKDNIFNWLKSFILNGREVVTFLGQHSLLYEMSSGVPQGSLLGSLLLHILMT